MLHLLLYKSVILVLLFRQCKVEGVVFVDEEERDRISSPSGFFYKGINEEVLTCCTTGNCTCYSFSQALVNVIDNGIINITSDVMLSSVVTIEGIENVLIVGYNNPTVHCHNTGGMKLVNSTNITIEGINWERCGYEHITSTNPWPVLQIFASSNITIRCCTFQHSVGQAIVLLDMMESVNINNCTFVRNKYYRDHGSAVHYSSQSEKSYTTCQLAINNCNFNNNTRAKSLVYIDGYNETSGWYASLQNSVFNGNKAVAIYISHKNVRIYGNNTFKGNYEVGIYTVHSNVTFTKTSYANFYNNVAISGAAIFSTYGSHVSIEGSSVVEFSGNIAIHHGGAIYSSDNSYIVFKDNSTITFTDNKAIKKGGAIYSDNHCHVLFEKNSVVIFTRNNATQDLMTGCCNIFAVAAHGGAIYSTGHSSISIKENSTVKFTQNFAKTNGGAIHSTDNASVSFEKHTIIAFNENTAEEYGGAIYSTGNSKILFTEMSTIDFIKNEAYTGGAVHSHEHSKVSFKENSNVTFASNSVTDFGGAICSSESSEILFEGKCTVTFTKNIAKLDGGAIKSYSQSFVSFENSSTSTFTENRAIQNGGAIHSAYRSGIAFEANCVVTFDENSATKDGGAIYSEYRSGIKFESNSTVNFAGNKAIYRGGAIYSTREVLISSTGYAKLSFNLSGAKWGGGIWSDFSSCLSFGGNSTTKFIRNSASRNGGAVTFNDHSSMKFTGNSTVLLSENFATHSGGAISCQENTSISFMQSSSVMFSSNTALHGGGIISKRRSKVVFEDTSVVTFINSKAERKGGAISLIDNSVIVCKETSMITYINNTATIGSGVFSDENCSILITERSLIKFINNSATSAGTLYSAYNSNLSFTGTSVCTFSGNRADQHGGAVYLTSDSHIITEGNMRLSFTNNVAENGGALYALQSNVRFGKNGDVQFANNNAQYGGALYVNSKCTVAFTDDSNVTFFQNRADGYGGAVYVKLTQSMVTINANLESHFHDNYAGVSGSSLYISVAKSCNNSCLRDNIIGIRKETLQNNQGIATPPKRLELYNPSICIRNNTKGECEVYFVNNIMLGQEIRADACVLDYYDLPCNPVQFAVSGENNINYHISGERETLIACGNDTLHGISITSKEISLYEYYNYTVTIMFNVNTNYDERQFSINLVVEISPCHPGFWYSNEAQKCICYEGTDAVFCSGSKSTIKRGYWFGSVNGQPTVTVCPVNYCNFSCCETTDGFYHLSPLRSDQCRSHRSGPACGNCEEGWTLSFDSAECVQVEKCTTGQTAMVMVLTVLYWIAVVVAVFVVMYFKIGIGYLYAISYYYSMLDILLNQTLYLSQWLLATFNAVSSVVKVTPQFLGQLCLAKGVSGIDQQFIHYVHPFAVTLILISISLIARISYKFSSFISRGIIHVICLLLLLSYTSVATTSLMLMRPLTFFEVNKVYTYLSPEIEYFHGRHLPYAIVALLCIIVIVIGLPLLLLLEPFVNHKISFTRIKPLLDQFQGCYKDKYRCFAAYYMICRLVIIIIVISTSPNDFLAQYILLSSCVLMATAHVIIRPYKHRLLNTVDGLILMLIILVAVLPISDSSNSSLVVGIILSLVVLPLTMIAALLLIANRKNLKLVCTYCNTSNNQRNPSRQIEIPVDEFNSIVDEEMRKNVTICDIKKLQSDDDFVRYRESFMEIMDEIQD